MTITEAFINAINQSLLPQFVCVITSLADSPISNFLDLKYLCGQRTKRKHAIVHTNDIKQNTCTCNLNPTWRINGSLYTNKLTILLITIIVLVNKLRLKISCVSCVLKAVKFCVKRKSQQFYSHQLFYVEIYINIQINAFIR